MSLRIRYQYSTGSTLGYSVERLSDGLFWDFAGSIFNALGSITTGNLIASLPEDTSNFAGRYKVTLVTTAAGWTDGDFAITIHNTAASNAVVGQLGCVMHSKDDATVIPSAGGIDPLTEPVPGSFASGTAGYVLGHLSAGTDPWAITPTSGYSAGTFGNLVVTNLNATVSSRSTYAGGTVQLAANGLDLIPCESLNARQALVEILAANCGVLSGAGTGPIVIKGAGTVTTRITATVDTYGNRSIVTMSPPT